MTSKRIAIDILREGETLITMHIPDVHSSRTSACCSALQMFLRARHPEIIAHDITAGENTARAEFKGVAFHARVSLTEATPTE